MQIVMNIDVEELPTTVGEWHDICELIKAHTGNAVLSQLIAAEKGPYVVEHKQATITWKRK